jgi:transglutaminase-like putative cysteine protease
MTRFHIDRLFFLVIASLAFMPLRVATAADSPVTVKLLTTEIVIETDGTYVVTEHWELLARNESAAQQAAQQASKYSESMADLDVVDAYTLKADGTKILVDPSAIFTQIPQGAANVNVPINDQKQKVIVFPNVGPGDVVAYTTRTHVKHPIFSGYFIDNDFAPRTVSIEEWRGSIVAPSSMPLSIESHDMTLTKEEKDATVVYQWTYAAPDALTEDDSQLSVYDHNPRYFASSFKDYDEFARAYESLAAPLIAVTPKIQMQADTITAGISDRRQQAEKIYDWVSGHIRYVEIALGRGAVVPHSAEAVLTNGYGDCKDHTVVFAALLKAKGIDSQIVLINLDNAYTLSKVPTLAQLNHAITWLPEFNLYVDTTAGVAPFGVLPFQEYGKPVVHATSGGQSLRRTPILPPGATSVSVKTATKIDLTGRISGETKTVASGPYSVTLRLIGQTILARGPENAAAAQLQALGVPGTGTFELGPPGDLSPDYAILGRFEVPEPQPQLLAGAGFGMIGGLRVIQTTGDLLMGPLWNFKLTGDDPTPCYSGHTDEVLSFEPPAGKHVVKLPSDTKIADDHLHFTAHWSLDGRTVLLRRDFDVTIDQPLCEGEVRKSAAKELSAIRDSFNAQLSLADD